MPLENEEVSQKELCRITGLTDRRHRQLADAGAIPHPIDGKWKVLEVFSGLLRYYRTAAERKTDALAAEELRRTRAEADLSEMKRDRMAGKLIELEAAAELWAEALGEMRNVIATFDLPKEMRARLMASVREIPLTDYQSANDETNDRSQAPRPPDSAADAD
jgi:phage terminase Nu1 subunit (DNA packaging protein)